MEDDVYAELYVGRERPRPITHWDARGESLLCGSWTKCLAPGFRVGWVVAKRHAERIQRLQLMSTLSTNVPSQLALADMLRQGGWTPTFAACATPWPSASSRCGQP